MDRVDQDLERRTRISDAERQSPRSLTVEDPALEESASFMEEDWESGNSVGVRQSNIAMNVSDVLYKPPALDLGDMIDWGEGMNASEMEASVSD